MQRDLRSTHVQYVPKNSPFPFYGPAVVRAPIFFKDGLYLLCLLFMFLLEGSWKAVLEQCKTLVGGKQYSARIASTG